MKASRSRRIGGIERHVGAAGLEDAEQRRRPAPASARAQTPTSTSGPTPRPRRRCASRSARASSSRVGQRLAPRRPPPPPPASAPPAPRTARAGRRSAGSPRAVSFHSSSSCCALGRGQQRQLGEAPVRARPPTPASSAREVAAAGARPSRASNRSVLYSSSAGQRRPPLSASVERQVELRRRPLVRRRPAAA